MSHTKYFLLRLGACENFWLSPHAFRGIVFARSLFWFDVRKCIEMYRWEGVRRCDHICWWQDTFFNLSRYIVQKEHTNFESKLSILTGRDAFSKVAKNVMSKLITVFAWICSVLSFFMDFTVAFITIFHISNPPPFGRIFLARCSKHGWQADPSLEY